MYPEADFSKEELLSKYENLFKCLKKEWYVYKGYEITEESIFNEDLTTEIFTYYIDPGNTQIDTEELGWFLDKVNLLINIDNNNATLKKIKESKIKQSDISIPPTAEHGITPKNAVLDDPYTTGEKQQIEKEKQSQAKATASYNRWVAADYAYSWWHLTNNPQYPFYAVAAGQNPLRTDYNALPYDGYNGKSQSSPRRGWLDCTNFVSQSLAAGGLAQNSSWKYATTGPTSSWGAAANFYDYFRWTYGIVTTDLALTGDVVQIIYQNSAKPFHTMIITTNAGNGLSNKYLTYHTTDRVNMKASTVFNSYSSVYFYMYHIF